MTITSEPILAAITTALFIVKLAPSFVHGGWLAAEIQCWYLIGAVLHNALPSQSLKSIEEKS
jgi:hypothetical protein